MGKATDFRYNTGATRVPWAAVGENYNVHDLMEIIRFLMQGQGEEYDAALEAVWQQVKKLDELASPPGKLSLGSKVEAAEAACNEYLGNRQFHSGPQNLLSAPGQRPSRGNLPRPAQLSSSSFLSPLLAGV